MDSMIRLLSAALMIFALGCGTKLPTTIGSDPEPTSPVITDKSPEEKTEKPDPKETTTPEKKEKQLPTYVSGALQNIDGSTFDLSQRSGKPRVILFSSYSCGVCQAEHEALTEHFRKHGVEQPKNVDFITVLVKAHPDDALEWLDWFGIEWPLVIDSKLLVKNYCSQVLFPCLIIETPEDGVVFEHIGKTEFTKIQEYTGPWQY